MNPLTLASAGLETGSLYALTALGLVLIYKAQGIVNFAHGEFLMVGAFVGFAAHEAAGGSYAVALPAAILGSAAVAAVVERGVIRPLADHPHAALAMATVGVSVAVRGAARLPFGSDIYTLPPILAGAPLVLGPVLLSPQSLVTLAIAAVLTLAVFLFLGRSRLGREITATQQNTFGAKIVGIDTGFIYSISWALAGAIGGAAGILAAPLTLLFPDMGADLLLKGFAAAVLGGFGSAPGAVAGGFLIGIIEKLAGGYIDTSLIEVTSYLVIILVIFVMPNGLFGRGGVRRV